MFLNNPESTLEGELGFSEACRGPSAGPVNWARGRTPASGSLNLPDGDSCPPLQPVAACGNAGRMPSNLAFTQKLESQTFI